jgi:hypothetical protein
MVDGVVVEDGPPDVDDAEQQEQEHRRHEGELDQRLGSLRAKARGRT